MGRYKIKKLLGEGTLCRVLEVEDIENNCIYALKIIKPIEKYIDMSKLEANTLDYILRQENAHMLPIIKI